MDATAISIIVQARSTSTRFPGKIFELIGNRQVLERVMDVCVHSAKYINNMTHQTGRICDVAIVTPVGDALLSKHQYTKYKVFEGPEHDVLARYVHAAKALNSDYIVRVTSDCPFIPSFTITSAINFAIKDQLDYITNADPRFRTHPDGHDVEVISKRLLEWLDENAKKPEHREHVTSFLVEALPPWAKKADIIGFCDLTAIKLSVDTPEDLKRLTDMYKDIYSKVNSSPKAFRL